MKQLIIGLLFPLFAIGQTVHHDGEKIIYKGSVKLNENATAEVHSRLQQVFPRVAEKLTDTITILSVQDDLHASGSIRLNSPYHIIKKLHFTIQLAPVSSGYDYTVDSIFITEKRRGWKESKTHSRELIEALEETGNAAIELEVLLNEIDLRIQKMLTLLENGMRNTGSSRGQKDTASAGNSNASK
ncbi:MAG TPA: hypothetical protein VGN63_24090 [Flavisolibacter sp.]|nr:hypothetical protein [Flavisolibacter sp.]